MHEVGLAQRMLELVLEAAKRAGATRVSSVALRHGAMSGVDLDSLTFAFEVACRGTAAEGARLDVTPVPVRLRCWSCGDEGATDPWQACASCGEMGFEVLSGREMQVDSIEAE